MPMVSIVSSTQDYNEAQRLVAALNDGEMNDQRAVTNGARLEDGDGRVWFGYDYDGNSWWITKSMSSESDPDYVAYEFNEQAEPSSGGTLSNL